MIVSLLFPLTLVILLLAAGMALRSRRKEALGRRLLLDDAAIDRIIEEGELFVEEDEPLDLEEIDDEEERFWSERWDEPSGEW
ncbi:MAG: hypothetical protein R3304_07025 [Longimicrobiales bacterium]|nr:hypothetical protein [Longimicrobiales bacterium]